jgi:hypothetical protein
MENVEKMLKGWILLGFGKMMNGSMNSVGKLKDVAMKVGDFKL